jgi:hypothetical protein
LVNARHRRRQQWRAAEGRGQAAADEIGSADDAESLGAFPDVGQPRVATGLAQKDQEVQEGHLVRVGSQADRQEPAHKEPSRARRQMLVHPLRGSDMIEGGHCRRSWTAATVKCRSSQSIETSDSGVHAAQPIQATDVAAVLLQLAIQLQHMFPLVELRKCSYLKLLADCLQLGVCGADPLSAEIEPVFADLGAPGPPAHSVARFKYKHAFACLLQATSRKQPCKTCSDYNDIEQARAGLLPARAKGHGV